MLTENQIKEFQRIYKKQFGKEISSEEASKGKNPDEIYCMECGKLIRRSVVFCNHCGAKLSLAKKYNPEKTEQRITYEVPATPKSKAVAITPLQLFLAIGHGYIPTRKIKQSSGSS